jgi:2'-5' RNA ligase
MASRIFAAIVVPEAVRQEVAAYAEQLRSFDKDRCVRWERPEKLHFTLKFLAEASDRELVVMQAVVELVAATSRGFTASIQGAGAFPDKRRPRVLWLGLDPGSAEMTGLAREIEAAARDQGIAAENRFFQPHLTIGRVRDARRSDAVMARHLGGSFRSTPFMADRVVLIESHLERAGSRYEVLSTHEFGALTSPPGISR